MKMKEMVDEQTPTDGEIKILNANLKKFGANNNLRNNRAELINQKSGTQQKKTDSQILHRTNTSMTDETIEKNL